MPFSFFFNTQSPSSPHENDGSKTRIKKEKIISRIFSIAMLCAYRTFKIENVVSHPLLGKTGVEFLVLLWHEDKKGLRCSFFNLKPSHVLEISFLKRNRH